MNVYRKLGFPNMLMWQMEDVLSVLCFPVCVIILDGPRSNMVYFQIDWLVPFLTMLGDSFLTWLDLGYDIDCVIHQVILLLIMLEDSLF